MNECKPLPGGGRRAARPAGGRGAVRARAYQGRAVQVDPIKPKLKAPGTKRLKLNCGMLLSTCGFKFSLRCYTKGHAAASNNLALCYEEGRGVPEQSLDRARGQGLTLVHFSAQRKCFPWDRGGV